MHECYGQKNKCVCITLGFFCIVPYCLICTLYNRWLMYLLKISVLHSLLNGDIKRDNICPKWWLPVAKRILGGIISAEGIGAILHNVQCFPSQYPALILLFLTEQVFNSTQKNCLYTNMQGLVQEILMCNP